MLFLYCANFRYFWNIMEIKNKSVRSRGKAFKRILPQIVQEDRHIEDDIYLFDEYFLNRLLKKPFKTDYSIGIEVLEGEGMAWVNDICYKFKAPCLLILLAGQIIAYKATEGKKVRTRVMVMSDNFTNSLYDMSLRMNDIYTTIMINPVIQMDKRGLVETDLFVRSLIAVCSHICNPERLNSAKFLVLSLFYGPLSELYARQGQEHKGRPSLICAEFIKLLKLHYREEHNVKYYASALCISERYLSLCVRQVSGRSPSFWISSYLIAQAKVLLCSDTRSILQISEELCFPSQSDFGKFFKKQCGVSPLSYRKANS